MFSYHFIFERPLWLILLGIIPLLWWLSFRSLAGLGPVRRIFAIAIRSLVLMLLIFAAAEFRLTKTSERLSVIYLLDQSESIPEVQRKLMLDYVRQEVKQHRNLQTQDRAGVIVFGGEAEIEIPPFDENVLVSQLETRVDREHTNLAAAMKMAQASFPEDAAKRIVIISDGNENIGDAMELARMMNEAGVGIDVIPVRYPIRGDVAVEKIVLPPDVRRGQPFEMRVVLNNTSVATKDNNGVIPGKLQIVRKTHDKEEILKDEAVTVAPGKTVLSLREEIDQPEFYTYEARFTVEPGFPDIIQNNIATSFTSVQGKGKVLLIEDWQTPGEFDLLVNKLRSDNIEVTVQQSNNLFKSLAELQPYDCVLLGNVPKSSGTDGANISGFSDAQISMLVRNTQQMGAGIIMLGGENSFGAGGWTNTELEAAMPVDFQIKAAKVEAVGALAMLMHASEMADGNHWQKVIGKEAIKALGGSDYCGVIHWGGNDQWLWAGGMVRVGPNRNQMLGALDKMQPGDMPAFDGAMVMIDKAMSGLPDAAVKHVILISDGDPSFNTPAVLTSLKNQNAKVTTVAIGAHGSIGTQIMKDISKATGGNYYEVANANALPRIYQKEARRVARSLVFERDTGFKPNIRYPHEILTGIKDPLPPITGYVLTHKKDSPLVELAITAPLPAGEGDNTILASWTYGLGRTVVFTTDCGKRWATSWTNWENYTKFFSQMVRWTMRPTGDTGKFSLATDVRDGKVRVTVTALDKNDEFLNFLDLSGSVVNPNNEAGGLKMEQTAPGRYVGEFDSKAAGSYFLMLSPGKGMAPIRAGVNVSYSAEFMDREPNESLLKSLSQLTPKDGPMGTLHAGLVTRDSLSKILEADTFRHDLPRAEHHEDMWHWLLLIGSCLFLSDVFIRRVMVNFTWVGVYYSKVRDFVLRRSPAPQKVEYLDRLRSRKAAVATAVEQQKASMRFEPQPDAPADLGVLDDAINSAGPVTKPPPLPDDGMAPGKTDPDDYTSRLLKAKRKAQGDDSGSK